MSDLKDDEFFADFFERNRGIVYGFFKNRGFSEQEAEDMAQTTFMRAFEGRKGFRQEASEKTWLLTIARNLWKNFLRENSAKKKKRTEISIDDAHDGLVDEGSVGPLHQLLHKDRLERLKYAVDQLPHKMRVVLYLRLFQGLKLSEIKTVVYGPESGSIGTVKSTLAAGQQRLKQILQEQESGGEPHEG